MKFTAAGDTAIQRVLTEYDGIESVRNFLAKGDVRFFNLETTVNKDNWMMFPKNERAYEFDFAGAITIHKSQGSQFEKVVVYDEWLGDAEFHRKLLYTGITRASKMLVVVK